MISSSKSRSLFLEDVSLCPASTVYDWETTLVVAPHPEDETLGCGGAIALLRDMGYRVHVLYLTHGSLPYRHILADSVSVKKKEEQVAYALEKLGIGQDSATFLHLRHQLVPKRGEPGFEEAVRLCMNELENFKPETLLLPYRAHVYDDHYATWEIMQEAVRKMPYPIRIVEYMIWKDSMKQQELISSEALKAWRLDVKSVLSQKIQSITEHHAWQGSRNEIQPLMTAQEAALPWETYLESYQAQA